jgi:hypothetical protein
LLSFIGHVVPVNTSGAFLIQIVVIAGVGFMIVAATLLRGRSNWGRANRSYFEKAAEAIGAGLCFD